MYILIVLGVLDIWFAFVWSEQKERHFFKKFDKNGFWNQDTQYAQHPQGKCYSKKVIQT